MKKALSLILAIAMLLALAACGKQEEQQPSTSDSSGDSAYPELQLSISTSGGDTGIDTIAANYFAELISEKTGGKVTARIYPQAQLAGGDQSKVAELLAAGGSFEFGICSGANLTSLSNSFQTHQLPFLYTSYAEAEAAFDGAGGEAYAEILDSKGITYVGALHNGLRHFTTTDTPIYTPDDLKGMKMRVPSGEVGMAVFKAMGADPVTVNFSELYTTLQMGTVDGQENGYDTCVGANLQEVQGYVTESAWQYDAWIVVANKATLASYDEATRAAILEAWDETVAWARASMVERDEEAKQKFIDAGATIIELTDEQHQAFVDAVEDVKMSFVEKYGEDICRAFGVID